MGDPNRRHAHFDKQWIERSCQGLKFGRVTVEAAATRQTSHIPRVICICDCDKHHERPFECDLSELTSYKRQNCGLCRLEDRYVETPWEQIFLSDEDRETSVRKWFERRFSKQIAETLIFRYGKIAKKLNISDGKSKHSRVSMHPEQWYRVTQQRCHYTGLPPRTNYEDDQGNQTNVRLNGLDQVTPGVGYVAGNVVACSADLNYIKFSLSKAQLEKLCIYFKSCDYHAEDPFLNKNLNACENKLGIKVKNQIIDLRRQRAGGVWTDDDLKAIIHLAHENMGNWR